MVYVLYALFNFVNYVFLLLCTLPDISSHSAVLCIFCV